MKTITKIKYTMFGVILCAGFAHYIYNAVTDYGLRTNKLHEMVAAQADDTSNMGGSGSCDGDIIRCGQYMAHDLKSITQKTDSKGKLIAFGINFGTYEKNTSYQVSITHLHCKDSRWKANKCDSRNEGYERVVIKDGTNTSGDSSSGGSTSGESTSGESTSGR